MSFPIISTSDLGQIEAALASFDERPVVYDPTEIAHAGVFVSIDSGGGLRIERGFVRPRMRHRVREAKATQATTRPNPSHVRRADWCNVPSSRSAGHRPNPRMVRTKPTD